MVEQQRLDARQIGTVHDLLDSTLQLGDVGGVDDLIAGGGGRARRGRDGYTRRRASGTG